MESKKVIERGGELILDQWGSLPRALKVNYPELDWSEELKRPPRGTKRTVPKMIQKTVNFWYDTYNRRSIFDQVAKKYNVQKITDWYKVNGSVINSEIQQLGGVELLKLYGTLPKAIQSCFPEHNWNNSRFKSSTFYLSVAEHRREFVDKLAKKLGVKKPEDWYKVSAAQVWQHGGAGLLRYFGGSFEKALISLMPDRQWEFPLGKMAQPSREEPFYFALGQLFPNNQVISKCPAFFNSKLIYDAYIPELSLAFQYVRGANDFFQESMYGILKTLTSLQQKRGTSHAHGVTLIEVPFWWDKNVSSLGAIITSVRPDIVLPVRTRQSKQSPQSSYKYTKQI